MPFVFPLNSKNIKTSTRISAQTKYKWTRRKGKWKRKRNEKKLKIVCLLRRILSNVSTNLFLLPFKWNSEKMGKSRKKIIFPNRHISLNERAYKCIFFIYKLKNLHFAASIEHSINVIMADMKQAHTQKMWAATNKCLKVLFWIPLGNKCAFFTFSVFINFCCFLVFSFAHFSNLIPF